MAERAAAERGGWSTDRHAAVPTTDLPVHAVPGLPALFNAWLGRSVAPLLAAAFPRELPETGLLRVHDAFVVRYDAEGGQRALPPHTDESEMSVTVALNPLADYDGGGTHFERGRHTARVEQGHIAAFLGGELWHSASPVSRGRRYIIAAFLYRHRPST